MEENIIKDPNKHYLTEEPFFISDAQGRIEILRPAGFWEDPSFWESK